MVLEASYTLQILCLVLRADHAKTDIYLLLHSILERKKKQGVFDLPGAGGAAIAIDLFAMAGTWTGFNVESAATDLLATGGTVIALLTEEGAATDMEAAAEVVDAACNGVGPCVDAGLPSRGG